MRSHVDVVSPADYAAFVKNSGKTSGAPGLAVFNQFGCASCHTFKPAGATGKIGPDLDNLAQYAKQANRGSLAAFTKESIVSPGAYIQPGYSDVMPHIFGSQIPAGQLTQLVQYLDQGAK
jgi:cytochrome c oxidase subunit 2